MLSLLPDFSEWYFMITYYFITMQVAAWLNSENVNVPLLAESCILINHSCNKSNNL